MGLRASDAEMPSGKKILNLAIMVLIAVLLCLLTMWIMILYLVSDRVVEQRSEGSATRTEAPQDVMAEKRTPFLKLQGEIKKASARKMSRPSRLSRNSSRVR